MLSKVKKHSENYYKPTPEKWRKIGDAMQDVSYIGAAAVALIAVPPVWLPVLIMGIGRLGKIITNFATHK